MLDGIKTIIRTTPVLSKVYPYLYDWKYRLERRCRRARLVLAGHRRSTGIRRLEGAWEKETLIIEGSHGGLGDNLLLSHLPRIAKETGAFKHVLISNVTPFRNAAYRRLVWEMNPFVDGFTDAPGLVFHNLIRERGQNPSRFAVREGMNFLDEIMLAYGLDDGVRYHEPEIYYKPKVVPQFEGKTLYDPNWVSPVIALVGPRSIARYFEAHQVAIDAQFAARRSGAALPTCQTIIHGSSIEEFCDIIYSCRGLYCLATGTAVLAAALGKGARVFYHRGIKPEFLVSRLHEYIDLDNTGIEDRKGPVD